MTRRALFHYVENRNRQGATRRSYVAVERLCYWEAEKIQLRERVCDHHSPRELRKRAQKLQLLTRAETDRQAEG